ncbi:Cytospin-B [Hypsibius exemplaris]|uniref:Cytospin-B n=1 Tax=Hypsibius exemplaris TaxID=2072580 RepID=A0A9X6NC67_HYPEX|nr:Cytospin-B [Hypsibius exemplaris]
MSVCALRLMDLSFFGWAIILPALAPLRHPDEPPPARFDLHFRGPPRNLDIVFRLGFDGVCAFEDRPDHGSCYVGFAPRITATHKISDATFCERALGLKPCGTFDYYSSAGVVIIHSDAVIIHSDAAVAAATVLVDIGLCAVAYLITSMKSSRTRSTTASATLNMAQSQPLSSSSSATNTASPSLLLASSSAVAASALAAATAVPRSSATLPATLRNPTTASLRSAAATGASSSRSQQPGSPAVSLAGGRKSPLLSKADVKSKRTLLVDAGGKSMKKHFLSKSNDSLSGGGSAVVKKSRNNVPTPQARGIRHPAVTSSINTAVSKKEKLPINTTTVLPLRHGEPLADASIPDISQEMRRSASSNCLESSAADSVRRLSIPADADRLTDASEMSVSSSLLLSSNFAPSQSGITLISAGTQTSDFEVVVVPSTAAASRRRSGDFTGGDREFLSLLEEHSEMSKQLSELCKVDGLPAGLGEATDSGLHAMDTSDGGCLARPTNDWDAQSNNSLCSEPSLAGLQDRIQQMEETHHSTHEELQATLQELAEMSDIVIVYKKENEDLTHEKAVLQEALLSMTEKVQVYQTQADSLKKMLYRQVAGDENSMPEDGTGSSENEKTLVELMKSLQEEKEDSQHQLDSALGHNNKLSADLENVQNKWQHLNSFCDQLESQKNESESHLSAAKDSIKRLELENTRYAALLDSEKSKVAQLETVAKTTAKADLDDLLDHVRREKNRVEEQLTNSDNRNRVLESDLEGLRSALKASEEKRARLEESLADNAQEFAHRLNQKVAEYRAQEEEIVRLKKEIEDLETQNQASETERVELLHRYENLRSEYSQEQHEWTHFQTDLLTAVRVANEFRTECEMKTKTVSEENQALKRKTDDLSGELERLKMRKAATPPKIVVPVTASVDPEVRPIRTSSATEPVPLQRSPAERDALAPRASRSTPNHQVSVKSIIQNLESNGRQTGRLASVAGKLTGIRRRDENIVRSESNSSLDSTDKMLDLDRYMIDDEPSMPGDGLKPILNIKQRNSLSGSVESKGSLHESLGSLAKGKGSKRNALLKFCQEKTLGYSGIDITNFSSSWNDGLAFCAFLHSYLPDRIPFRELDSKDKRRNFSLAFEAAKSIGVQPTLEINDLLSDDRPDWRSVMGFVVAIYTHFEM